MYICRRRSLIEEPSKKDQFCYQVVELIVSVYSKQTELTAVKAQQDFPFLHIWNIGTSRNFVYCKVCVQNSSVVSFYANNCIPKMAAVEGTQFRGVIIRAHMTKKYHIESVKAWKNKLKEGSVEGATNLVRMITKINERLANRIGGYVSHYQHSVGHHARLVTKLEMPSISTIPSKTPKT